MRTMRRSLALALLLLMSDAVRGYAWNPAGHMLTGAIAYRELRAADPAALRTVLTLLRKHPDYQARWLPRMNGLNLQGADRDTYLFAAAARWPDDIRDDARLNRTAWHFTNLPYKPAGQPASVTEQTDPRDNMVTAYAENLAIALGAQSTDARKAMALAWIFHLVGDVHQPMHTVQLFTTQYSRGDRGGNDFFVRAQPYDRPVRLHSYWDGLVLESDRYSDVRARATELQARAPLRRTSFRTQLLEPQFEDWAREESFVIARDTAYLAGKLAGASEQRMNSAPTLPPGYPAQARRVAERQLVLAGYRLADLLAAHY